MGQGNQEEDRWQRGDRRPLWGSRNLLCEAAGGGIEFCLDLGRQQEEASVASPAKAAGRTSSAWSGWEREPPQAFCRFAGKQIGLEWIP